METYQQTILIAEDNDSNYKLLQAILGKDYQLIWVKNGRDAIAAVDSSSVDLVLMDIKMPEVDGIEALCEIRKTKKDLPVLMQTAYAFDSDRDHAVKAGCNGFVTKPINVTILRNTIKELLEKAE